MAEDVAVLDGGRSVQRFGGGERNRGGERSIARSEWPSEAKRDNPPVNDSAKCRNSPERPNNPVSRVQNPPRALQRHVKREVSLHIIQKAADEPPELFHMQRRLFETSIIPRRFSTPSA
jgi:hypothetical protein